MWGASAFKQAMQNLPPSPALPNLPGHCEKRPYGFLSWSANRQQVGIVFGNAGTRLYYGETRLPIAAAVRQRSWAVNTTGSYFEP
jgi:hypothetical protein